MPEAAAPSSSAAGLEPAGRCDGIAGDAETTTGPPEAGRLDRILATRRAAYAIQDAGRTPGQRQQLAEALAYAESRTPKSERRLQAMVVALESEVAALTDALAAMTHEHEPAGRLSTEGPVHVIKLPICARCGLAADAHLHRTPARVRAELEGL